MSNATAKIFADTEDGKGIEIGTATPGESEGSWALNVDEKYQDVAVENMKIVEDPKPDDEVKVVVDDLGTPDPERQPQPRRK